MVKLRCINPFSGNFKISLRVVGFFLEFPYQVPDTCLKVPCLACPHCSDVDPPLPSTGTSAGGQEGKGMRKITADMMAKQEQLSAEAKGAVLKVCLQGACLNLRSQGGRKQRSSKEIKTLRGQTQEQRLLEGEDF